MKKFIFTLILTTLLFVFSSNTSVFNKNLYSTASVLDRAWNMYGLTSYQVGETNTLITIFMDETKSEKELREYLNRNLSEVDLKRYEIEIFKINIEAAEKEHMEYLLQDENS